MVISCYGKAGMNWLSTPYRKYSHDIIKCHLKTHRYIKMAMVQENFLHTITNMLGFSVKQREVISDDGYDTIYTIINWKYDKIREWCTTKSKLTTIRGGASYGYLKSISYGRCHSGPKNCPSGVNRLSYLTLIPI